MHIQRTNILAPAIAALAIAAFLLMQDRQGTVYPEALLRADSIVSKQPDSAAVILDGLEHGMASAPEAVRMRYRLIRQKQIAYSFGSFTSDSAARALVEYYETRGELSCPGLRNRPYGHMERHALPCQTAHGHRRAAAARSCHGHCKQNIPHAMPLRHARAECSLAAEASLPAIISRCPP